MCGGVLGNRMALDDNAVGLNAFDGMTINPRSSSRSSIGKTLFLRLLQRFRNDEHDDCRQTLENGNRTHLLQCCIPQFETNNKEQNSLVVLLLLWVCCRRLGNNEEHCV